MIRINLLPVRAAKKKESIRLQLTIAALATFFVFVVTLAVYVYVRTDVSGVADEIGRGAKEQEVLTRKIGELSKIEQQKKVVEEKLNTIKALEAARSGPVDLFRNISESMPEKAWINSVIDSGQSTLLKGYAADEKTVAEFQRRLQERKVIANSVELEVAQRMIEAETGVEVVNFDIRLVKEIQTPPVKAKAKEQKEK